MVRVGVGLGLWTGLGWNGLAWDGLGWNELGGVFFVTQSAEVGGKYKMDINLKVFFRNIFIAA